MARGNLAPQMIARILDHVRAQDMRQGHHLAAQQLADTFRVSRAPIVSALKKLEEMGVVRAEANRGFFLVSDAANLPELPDQAEGEDPAYFRIAEDRLSGRLAARVSETELMRIYSLPRGRLLKILHQIADEGWIDRLPGNGWEFREVLTSRKAYADAYEFRAAIEMQALLQPGFRSDPKAFAAARAHQQALLVSYEDQSRSAIFGTNVDFHEMLMGCADNPFFLDAVRRVNRLRRLMEYRITQDRSRLPQQCREHLQLLDLIEAGDMPVAVAFLHRHIHEAGRLKAAMFE